jgi:hypothetical protein
MSAAMAFKSISLDRTSINCPVACSPAAGCSLVKPETLTLLKTQFMQQEVPVDDAPERSVVEISGSTDLN